MSSVDFAKLLGKPAESIERPKPLPAGPYIGVIKSRAFDTSKEKKTPFVRYMVGVQGPGDGFTEHDALQGIDLTSKTLRKDYYITDTSEYRHVDFLESLGINKSNKSVAEMVEEAVGRPVLMNVILKSNHDGTEQFNEIESITGLK